MLLERCIPSVQQQGYPNVEHIVVSDGPDPVLRERLRQPWLDGWKNLWYHELPAHPMDPHKGVPCRLAGLELASGDYVTYCDDDDSSPPVPLPHAGRRAGRASGGGVRGVPDGQSHPGRQQHYRRGRAGAGPRAGGHADDHAPPGDHGARNLGAVVGV